MIGNVKIYELGCGTTLEVEYLKPHEEGKGPTLMVRFNHPAVKKATKEELEGCSPLAGFTKGIGLPCDSVFSFVILGKAIGVLDQVVGDWKKEKERIEGIERLYRELTENDQRQDQA